MKMTVPLGETAQESPKPDAYRVKESRSAPRSFRAPGQPHLPVTLLPSAAHSQVSLHTAPPTPARTCPKPGQYSHPYAVHSPALSMGSFSLSLIHAPVDDHRSFHPGLSSPRRLAVPTTADTCLQLRGQQGPGILTVAQDLHLDVSEVWKALVVGGFFPQPDVGGLGAGSNRRWERSGQVDMSSLTMAPCLLWGHGPTDFERNTLGASLCPGPRMVRLRPN